MKKLYFVAVVVGCLFLLSCAHVINFMDPAGPRYAGSFAAAHHILSHIAEDEIRVVTYNIAWAKEVDLAITELDHYKNLDEADIVLLQEMDATSVIKMADALDYNYIYYPGSIHNINDKDIGNAILSTWPLTDGKKMILPHKQSWNDRIRTATVATVWVDNRPVRVYNVHAATIMMSEDKQFDQLEAVAEDAENAYDYVIIGGDFNTARPGSVARSEKIFASAGFARVTQAAGFTAKMLGFHFTLDHIYAKGLAAVASGTVKAAQASDHLPLWTRLRFQKPEPALAKIGGGL